MPDQDQILEPQAWVNKFEAYNKEKHNQDFNKYDTHGLFNQYAEKLDEIDKLSLSDNTKKNLKDWVAYEHMRLFFKIQKNFQEESTHESFILASNQLLGIKKKENNEDEEREDKEKKSEFKSEDWDPIYRWLEENKIEHNNYLLLMKPILDEYIYHRVLFETEDLDNELKKLLISCHNIYLKEAKQEALDKKEELLLERLVNIRKPVRDRTLFGKVDHNIKSTHHYTHETNLEYIPFISSSLTRILPLHEGFEDDFFKLIGERTQKEFSPRARLTLKKFLLGKFSLEETFNIFKEIETASAEVNEENAIELSFIQKHHTAIQVIKIIVLSLLIAGAIAAVATGIGVGIVCVLGALGYVTAGVFGWAGFLAGASAGWGLFTAGTLFTGTAVTAGVVGGGIYGLSESLAVSRVKPLQRFDDEQPDEPKKQKEIHVTGSYLNYVEAGFDLTHSAETKNQVGNEETTKQKGTVLSREDDDTDTDDSHLHPHR